MARQKGSDVLLPNLGVYYSVPPIAVPERGLQDCRNVRISEGQLTNFNVGWRRFSTNWTLNGVVKLIDNFFDSTGAQKLIFATLDDLYEWVEADDSLRFLTPRYTTGTVSINNGSPTLTGVGTAWLTSGIKAGDRIFIGGPMRGTDTDMPRFIRAGAGAAATAPASVLAPYPTITTADAGNLLIAHLTYVGDVVHVPGTPAGWSLVYTDDVGSPATGRSFIYSRRCVGTEVGTIAFTTAGGTTRVGGRIYMFRSAQTKLATTAAAGTSATVADVGVTTTAAAQLALNFIAVHNGSVIAPFTGQTGGTWAEATGEFADAVTLRLSLQMALMPTVGTIDGGTLTVTSGSWGVRGMALEVPAWYTVLTVDNNTQITLTSNWTEANVAGLTYSARLLLTGDENDIWSTELFHNGLPGPADWWIGTNGINNVVSWNGTDPACVYHTEFGFTCKALIKWYNMMLYANLNVGGSARRTSIRNSDIGSPFDVVGGVSAEMVAHDGVDEILALFTMADNLVVYSIRNVTLVAFVGDPQFFAFRTAIAGIGPLSANAIADFGDNHEWLGPDAAYIFDGITADEVHYHVMREIIRICPAMRYNQIIVHFAEETGEIYWIIPLTTDTSQLSPSTAYSEHYLENVPKDTPTPFTVRDMPATATGYFESLNTLTWDELTVPWSSQNFRWDDRFFTASFPLNLFGTEDGKIMIIGVTDDQDGAEIISFVKFARRPVIDSLMRGCVKRVYVFATKLGSAAYDLDVTVTTTDQVGGEGVVGTVLPYNLRHEGRRFVNPFAVGRFFDVTFGTTGTDRGWILQGYDVENTALGERDAPT